MNDLLTLRILSAKKVIYQGQVKSVSSKNNLGPFDILPAHANFISIIENQPIQVIDSQNHPLTFNLAFAIIFTTANKVNIYTDISQKAGMPENQKSR